MTLGKAIEILDLRQKQLLEPDHSDLYPAIRLGIEALKEIKSLKESHVLDSDGFLPGETEE
ncbi:hypothetical protein ES703_50009 [subsurface metagenome]